MAKGHLFGTCLFPFDRADELVEVELEIIDIETSLAETRLVFLPLVNRNIKVHEYQSVRFLIGRNERDFS